MFTNNKTSLPDKLFLVDACKATEIENDNLAVIYPLFKLKILLGSINTLKSTSGLILHNVKQCSGTYVVYFDQCLGAAHSKRWSKSAFLFFVCFCKI